VNGPPARERLTVVAIKRLIATRLKEQQKSVRLSGNLDDDIV
jgi:hypothetical protein